MPDTHTDKLAGSLTVGGTLHKKSGNTTFNGVIDEIYIINEALSTEEIKALSSP